MRKPFVLALMFGLAAGLVTFVPQAWAVTVTRVVAAIGYPVSADGCFTPYYGGVINNCGSTKTWEIPMVLREAGGDGNLSVEVTLPTGATSTRCQATMLIGNSVYSSGWAYSTPATGQIITSVFYPSAGDGYTTCQVVTGGQLWATGYYKY
jgi:hypothetical protein